MTDDLLTGLCGRLQYSFWEVLAAWDDEQLLLDCFLVQQYAAADGSMVSGIDFLEQLSQRPETVMAAYQLLQQQLPADFQLQPVYSKWHRLGREVVSNIQSLAAAQAEDKRRSVQLRRSQLRQAQAIDNRRQAAADDESDSDSSEVLDMEEDPWSGYDAEAPLDPTEFMQDLLDLPESARRGDAGAYLATGLSRLPPLDFGHVHQQRSHQPSGSDPVYKTKPAVRNLLQTADLAQAAATAAEVAAAAAQGYTWFDLQGVGPVRVTAMELRHSGSPAVHASIQYLAADAATAAAPLQEAALQPKQHGPPPDVKLPQAPTIVDTVRLFTLSTEQAFALVQLAEALLEEVQGRLLQQPLRMVLTGEPGTGKSQVLKAFQWFALQHDASHLILVAAYQWRAALQVATAKHPARSTCKAFAINPYDGTFTDCSQLLEGVRFVFLDEYSFINSGHLHLISMSIRKAQGLTAGDGRAFGDMNLAVCGDLCQHKPVGGTPLFTDDDSRPASKQLSARDVTGLAAYRMLDRVVFLQQQQRIAAEDDQLFAHSRLFISEQQPSREAVAAFCDDLNQKVVTPALLQQWAAEGGVPRVVCLRNEIRKHFNYRLGSLHAKQTGVRPIVWFGRDAVAPGRGNSLAADPAMTPAVPAQLRAAIALLPPEYTKHVPAMQLFFPGCRYTFTDNLAPNLGVVNNSECEGVDLLLAPGEQDTGEHDCWMLQKPPVALFVRPLDASVSRAAWEAMRVDFPTLPQGCIPVTSGWSDAFPVQYQQELLTPDGGSYTPQRHVSRRVSVKRFGFALSDAYAVTDFYCQGMSFKQARWMAHLNPPPGGKAYGLKRANVFVVLTRWGEWDNVWLIAPLWPAGDAAAREAVIDEFLRLAVLEADLKKELRRLRTAAAAAKVAYADQWQAAVAATAPQADDVVG
jgi:hypothetical protein